MSGCIREVPLLATVEALLFLFEPLRLPVQVYMLKVNVNQSTALSELQGGGFLTEVGM